MLNVYNKFYTNGESGGISVPLFRLLEWEMLSGSYLHSLSPLRKEAHTYLSRSKNEETGEMLPPSIVNPIVEHNSARSSKLKAPPTPNIN